MFNTVTRMYEGRFRKFKYDIKATEELEPLKSANYYF